MKEEKKKGIIRQKISKRDPIFKLLNLKQKLLRSAFLLVLFIMFYMVIIAFAESEDETLKCDHSNESY